MRNLTRPTLHKSEKPSPHPGTTTPEPLGPSTPDGRIPLGDTPEAHDEIVPQDLPKRHPGRRAAERQAAAGDGTTRGDIPLRRRGIRRFRRRS